MRYLPILNWRERCRARPEHAHGMVTESMLKLRMQEEIGDLRKEVKDVLQRVG